MFDTIRNKLQALCLNEHFEIKARPIWAFFWALLPATLYGCLIGSDPSLIEAVIFFAILSAAFIEFRIPVDRISFKNLGSNLGYSSAIFCAAWLARSITTDEQFTKEAVALIEDNTGMVLFSAFVFFVMSGILGGISYSRPKSGQWKIAYGSRLSADDEKFFGPWTRLQMNDAEVIATHEAGHAVVIGLFRYNLPDLTAAMTSLINGQVISGYCTGPSLRGNLKTRVYLELEMITFLAGVEAEEMILGERSCGAIHDYRVWLEMAEKFLATDLNSIFYILPKNDTQKSHNHQLLSTLKVEQAKMARKILEANIGVLQKIRDRILENRKINGQELLDMLSKVVMVEGCPVISERTKSCYIRRSERNQ